MPASTASLAACGVSRSRDRRFVVADNSRARMASGEVRAFDRRSGALRWTFHPLPEKHRPPAAPTRGHSSPSTTPTDSCSCQRAVRALTTTADSAPATTDTPTAVVVLRAATGEIVVVVSDRAPRSLGLRRRIAAAALSGQGRRGGRRGVEDRSPLSFRTPHRATNLPHSRAPGSGERRDR